MTFQGTIYKHFSCSPNAVGKLHHKLMFDSIRRLVLAVIEDPYSIEQLREPRMNVLIVKPLVDRLYDENDISVGMI